MVQTSLKTLEQQIGRLKTAIDKCDMTSIYVHTFQIGQRMKSIDLMDKTENDKIIIAKLDDDTFNQFQKLTKGRCSCSMTSDI